MATDPISLTFSGIALALSATTAWFTLWRRGSVQMARPSLIFLGPDGSRGPAKVFVRAFVYSTADRGQVVDQIFVRLRHQSETTSFTSWIMRDGSLSRGAGLLVDRRGAAHDHHFVLVDREQGMVFQEGEYVLELLATCVGVRRPVLLTKQLLYVTAEQSQALSRLDSGLFFDWNPELQQYHSRLDRNPTAELNVALQESMKLPRDAGRRAVSLQPTDREPPR